MFNTFSYGSNWDEFIKELHLFDERRCLAVCCFFGCSDWLKSSFCYFHRVMAAQLRMAVGRLSLDHQMQKLWILWLLIFQVLTTDFTNHVIIHETPWVTCWIQGLPVHNTDEQLNMHVVCINSAFLRGNLRKPVRLHKLSGWHVGSRILLSYRLTRV